MVAKKRNKLVHFVLAQSLKIFSDVKIQDIIVFK